MVPNTDLEKKTANVNQEVVSVSSIPGLLFVTTTVDFLSKMVCLCFGGFFGLCSMKALSTSRIMSAFFFVIVFALSSCHCFIFQLATAFSPPKSIATAGQGTPQCNARKGGARLGVGTGLLTQQGLHPPHKTSSVRNETTTITMVGGTALKVFLRGRIFSDVSLNLRTMISPVGEAQGLLLRVSKVVLAKGFLGIVPTCHDTCHNILFNKITSF